jgi:hypothetical protein
MKQTNFYIVIGAGLLSLAAFVIAKANERFAQFNEACFVGVSGVSLRATGHLTSIKSPGSHTFWLATRAIGGSTVLHTGVTCANKFVQLYLK